MQLKKAAAAYFKCEALPVFGAANPMVPEELDKKGDRESLDTFEKKWACYNVPMKLYNRMAMMSLWQVVCWAFFCQKKLTKNRRKALSC